MFNRLNVFYGLARLAPDSTVGSAAAETGVFLNQIAEELKIDRATTHIVLTPILDHISATPDWRFRLSWVPSS